MHSINNCMDGSRFSSRSHGCCPTVVWKRCRGGALLIHWPLLSCIILPCLHTFWHAIPTSFYIFKRFFIFLYIYYPVDISTTGFSYSRAVQYHAILRGCYCMGVIARVLMHECYCTGPGAMCRVANVKNQPPNFKQLTPCAWRAHWCLNNRTLKLHSQAYIARELHRNCFTWLRG